MKFEGVDMRPWKSTLICVVFCVVLALLLSTCECNAAEDRNSEENALKISSLYFARKLIEEYGSNATISAEEIDNLISDIRLRGLKHETEEEGPDRSKITERSEEFEEDGELCMEEDSQERELCLQRKCMDGADILSLASNHTERADSGILAQLSSALLWRVTQDSQCHHEPHGTHTDPAEVWGYSFLCVTVINLCSLMGVVFMPLMKRSFYQKLLMFMVALAVGTLVGSSLLFLIPEAFEMNSEESMNYHSYIWKASTVLGGIYLFFLVERVLKHIMDWRNRKELKKEVTVIDPDVADIYADGTKDPEHISSSIPTTTAHRDPDSFNMTFDVPEQMNRMRDTRKCEHHAIAPNVSAISMETQITQVDSEFGCSEKNCGVSFQAGSSTATSSSTTPNPSLSAHSTHIKSVAWMVIVGDGLHNFIDGLSIGAAFAKNILAGVSISVAVVCEELPHELGDFAILLNSGMSMRQALGYNFLSACMCYVGLVCGILVGEMTSGSTWIFALAGGMFLYISLVDMLPEVNVAAEEEGKKTGRSLHIFLLQNCGLLAGYAIMLTLALFSDRIDFQHS